MFKHIKQGYSTILNRIKVIIEKYREILRYEDETVEKEIILSNIQRIIPFSLFIIVLQIINIINLLILSKLPSNIKLSLFLIISCLIVTCIIFSFFASSIDNPNNFSKKRGASIIYIFLFFMLVGNIFFSIIEIHYFGTITSFLIICISIAIYPLLKPRQVSLYVFSVLLISILVLPDYNLTVILDMIATVVSCVFISQFCYLSYKMAKIREFDLININKELQFKLETDFLTKVLNRYGLDKKVKTILPYVIRSKIPVSVLMIDIDYFKNYNDKFGHKEGDICLKKVATEIKKTMHSDTDIICRWGGEEFLVIIYEVNKNETLKIAKRVKKAIRNLKIMTSSNKVDKFITISIGAINKVLTYYKDYEELKEIADEELYYAKDNGRNCISMNHNIYK